MATDQQLIDSLRAAAEKLLGRRLTPGEVKDLTDRFGRAQGSFRGRAREAIKGFTRLDERELIEKAAASDDTDRVISDMDRTADDWKPGT